MTFEESGKTWKETWKEEARERMAQVLTDGKALSK
jgi:hypothetical protein